jgi:hypothetical protein
MALFPSKSILRNRKSAQVLNGPRSSYDYVTERVRDNPDGPSSVDLAEAKHWYRQVYQQVSPFFGSIKPLFPYTLLAGHD